MRKKSPIIVCSILFVVFAITAFARILLNPLPDEYFIFQNLEECERLIPSNLAGTNIERYHTPTDDKDLKDLSYHTFWGVNFQSGTLKYKLFAYEFENSDSALKYYVNVTGENFYEKRLPLNEQEDNILLSASRGATTYQIVVVSQNRAYQLNAPNKYADEINELLAQTFSQKLP